jgi:exopolysaccharide biosynthesis polyprenyl glycosylphosphotransferase
LDQRFWTEENYSIPVNGYIRFLQIAFKFLVPGPFVHGVRLALAGSMLADGSLVVLTFAAITSLSALIGSPANGLKLVRFDLHLFQTPALWLGMLYGALFTLLGYSEHLYDEAIGRSWQQRVTLGKVVAWSSLLFASAFELSGAGTRLVACIVATIPLNYLTMSVWRNWRSHSELRRRATRQCRRNVLIIGAGGIERRVAAQLPAASCHVVGFLDDNDPITDDVLGRVGDLRRISLSEFVDEVVIALPLRSDLANSAIAEARSIGLNIKLVIDLSGLAPKARSTQFRRTNDFPLLTLDEKPLPELCLFLKRGLDILLSAFGLIVLSPMLIAVSIAVKLDSPGPILYRAPRAGKRGSHFACLKFRTMIADADRSKSKLRLVNERQGAFFKLANDPRVTRVGRFLRRYSVDELPQLWNVLRGEMSLVGPRPHPLDDFDRYQLGDLKRLHVTPGITGLWQVTARRDPSFQRNIALDLEYIQQWSLWMDLKILCKTVPAVLQGSGA